MTAGALTPTVGEPTEILMSKKNRKLNSSIALAAAIAAIIVAVIEIWKLL